MTVRSTASHDAGAALGANAARRRASTGPRPRGAPSAGRTVRRVTGQAHGARVAAGVTASATVAALLLAALTTPASSAVPRATAPVAAWTVTGPVGPAGPVLVGLGPAGPVLSGPQAADGYVAPVAGEVARPFDPPAQEWLAGHRGVDLRAAIGDPVGAPAAGVVTFAGSVAGKPTVVVTHRDGLRSSLEPVAATVAVGTQVAAGEPVGTLASGPGDDANPDHCAPATCVHWGVRRGETYLDPLALLGRAAPIVLLPSR
ncbi:murein hydrolase activator EnvC family protein [Puerhibacterium puerhi]|uniref:murein hydrolase activator EnvC family protein n=1 Tax=Puerhibacterium puerhi TaxID=2692623 RepID=UPI001359DF66|nr:M23 family metallopeptidase [Puerhibacterium puerhi]